MFKGAPLGAKKKKTFCPPRSFGVIAMAMLALARAVDRFAKVETCGGEDFWVGTVRAYEAEAQREKPGGEIRLLRPKFREASVQKLGF